jgi:hypothetical protein
LVLTSQQEFLESSNRTKQAGKKILVDWLDKVVVEAVLHRARRVEGPSPVKAKSSISRPCGCARIRVDNDVHKGAHEIGA